VARATQAAQEPSKMCQPCERNNWRVMNADHQSTRMQEHALAARVWVCSVLHALKVAAKRLSGARARAYDFAKYDVQARQHVMACGAFATGTLHRYRMKGHLAAPLATGPVSSCLFGNMPLRQNQEAKGTVRKSHPFGHAFIPGDAQIPGACIE
jgi:hypothetical protein